MCSTYKLEERHLQRRILSNTFPRKLEELEEVVEEEELALVAHWLELSILQSKIRCDDSYHLLQTKHYSLQESNLAYLMAQIIHNDC